VEERSGGVDELAEETAWAPRHVTSHGGRRALVVNGEEVVVVLVMSVV
jgi:hypothetical protein